MYDILRLFTRSGYGMGYYRGFDWTYLLVIIGAVISLYCSARVKSSFKKYSRVLASSGMTGAQVAEAILKKEGLYDVTVARVSGDLTDNYNPSTKIVNLSESVYDSRSVAAIGVAAHECGHALQHSEEYAPFRLRSMAVPVANFGSKAGLPILIVGLIFGYFQPLISLGIILFSCGVAFHVLTLPVEFDASRRAVAIIEQMGIVREGSELNGAKKVLKSAAMTYVAAAASQILTLIRLIILFGGGGRRKD